MSLKNASGSFLRGRWKHVVLGVAAVLFLAPVPALGFVFVTPWSFVQTQVAAPAAVTSQGTNATNGEFLNIDMGFVQPNKPNTTLPESISYITATRQLQVNAAQESLVVARNFETLLQGGDLKVFVYLEPTNGGTRLDLPSFTARSGIRFGKLIQNNDRLQVNLGAGTYNLVIRIKYRKNRFGLWDNSNPRPGSQHTFVFTSL